VVLSVIVVVCALTASFALWLNRAVYDSENFSRSTVTVIQKPAVRNAVSGEIVDRIIEELPEGINIPEGVVAGPARSVVSSLLADPSFRPVLEKLATQLDKAITADEPTAIRLDTRDIKAEAKPLVNTINAQLNTNVQVTDLPDSFVLIKKGLIPSISSWGIVLLWLGPILGVIGAVIVVAMLLLATAETRPMVLKVLVGSVLFIALIGLMRSPVVASVEGANAKVIAGNLFSTLTSSLASQTWVLAGIGLVLAAVGYLLPRLAVQPAPVAKQRRKAA